METKSYPKEIEGSYLQSRRMSISAVHSLRMDQHVTRWARSVRCWSKFLWAELLKRKQIVNHWWYNRKRECDSTKWNEKDFKLTYDLKVHITVSRWRKFKVNAASEVASVFLLPKEKLKRKMRKENRWSFLKRKEKTFRSKGNSILLEGGVLRSLPLLDLWQAPRETL